MNDTQRARREEMVKYQIAQRGLKNPRLLAALTRVERHRFVPPEMQSSAYEDCPLPIGLGQTISQPYIVALMTNLLQLEGTENVLEIGTGSGYQAAVLAELARTVHTVERHALLAERAAGLLGELGYANISVHAGDGSMGWPDDAPYQGILVTAAAPSPPPPLLGQLAEGGRLVLPVGNRHSQELQVWQRFGSNFEQDDIIPVAFVPLRGVHGWSEDRWDETTRFGRDIE